MISVSKRNWQEIKINKNIIKKIQQVNNFSDIVSRLIVSRKFDLEEIYSIKNYLELPNKFKNNLDFINSSKLIENAINLITDNKKVAYFECTPSLPLKIEAKGKKRLRIMSRLEFTDIMGQEESYRIRVREGKKVLGTFYFNTERSSESQIENKSDKVPGKWRSCEINVPKGKHTYTIEVADKGKTILNRFIVY